MITVRTTEKTRLFWRLRQAEVGSLPLEKSGFLQTSPAPDPTHTSRELRTEHSGSIYFVTEALRLRWGNNKVDVNLGYIVKPCVQGNRTGSIKTKKKQAWNRLTRATTSGHKHLRTVTAGAALTSLSYPATPLVKLNGMAGDVIYRGHKSWWCGQNSFQAHENPTFNFLYFNPGSRVNTDKTNKGQLLKGGKVLHWPQLEAVTLRNLYQPTCKHEAYSK